MAFSRHINITGTALRRWVVAQCYDSAAVGALWWIGLDYLHIPWAPFWAILAAVLQFIPHFGPVMAAMGPLLVALFAGGLEQFLYVLMLYGGIIVIDGLLLQPIIMRRTARVPVGASLIVPVVLSFIFGFWGLLLAAPLLAIIFAYRSLNRRDAAMPVPQQTPPGQIITGGRLVSPGAPTGHIPPQE
jgi:predicted PurR-regulated permease PerM